MALGQILAFAGLEERFWSRVDKRGDDECWLWAACVCGYAPFQYGQFCLPESLAARLGVSRTQKAHRMAYEFAVGPIPDGLQIHHRCEVTRCVNPGHLEAVDSRTHSLYRSHGWAAEKNAQTHCIHGHRLSGGNLYVEKRPGRAPRRQCRECHRLRMRATRAAQAA